MRRFPAARCSLRSADPGTRPEFASGPLVSAAARRPCRRDRRLAPRRPPERRGAARQIVADRRRVDVRRGPALPVAFLVAHPQPARAPPAVRPRDTDAGTFVRACATPTPCRSWCARPSRRSSRRSQYGAASPPAGTAPTGPSPSPGTPAASPRCPPRVTIVSFMPAPLPRPVRPAGRSPTAASMLDRDPGGPRRRLWTTASCGQPRSPVPLPAARHPTAPRSPERPGRHRLTPTPSRTAPAPPGTAAAPPPPDPAPGPGRTPPPPPAAAAPPPARTAAPAPAPPAGSPLHQRPADDAGHHQQHRQPSSAP